MNLIVGVYKPIPDLPVPYMTIPPQKKTRQLWPSDSALSLHTFFSPEILMCCNRKFSSRNHTKTNYKQTDQKLQTLVKKLEKSHRRPTSFQGSGFGTDRRPTAKPSNKIYLPKKKEKTGQGQGKVDSIWILES